MDIRQSMRRLAASERGARLLFIALLLPLALLLSLGWRSCSVLGFKQREALAKQRLHQVQLALERFAVDQDGVYPSSVELLVGTDYLPAMPLNPFSGQPMHCIPLSADMQPLQEPRQGDFGYLARYNPQGEVDGYSLALYTRY